MPPRDTPTPTKMLECPVKPNTFGSEKAFRKEKWTSPEDVARHYARAIEQEPSPKPTRRGMRARLGDKGRAQEPPERWKLKVVFGQTVRTKVTDDDDTSGEIITGRFPYDPRGFGSIQTKPPTSRSAEKPPRTPQSAKKKPPRTPRSQKPPMGMGRLTPLQKAASAKNTPSKFKGDLNTNLEKAKVFVKLS